MLQNLIYSWVNIGSDNGLMHDGIKSLPEQMVTKLCDASREQWLDLWYNR